jgi:hypothetical protein
MNGPLLFESRMLFEELVGKYERDRAAHFLEQLEGGDPTIDLDYLTSNESRLLSQQKRCCLSNFFGIADSFQGMTIC